MAYMTECLDTTASLPCVHDDLEGWSRLLKAVHGCMTGLERDAAQLVALTTATKKLELRKQAKETILRLNDDFLELDCKNRQFETEASDRSRLTNRKANSSFLLHQERFRKESKAK